MGKKRKPLPAEPVAADVASLSHDGRGVAHVDGKAVFVHGALPGERVLFRYTRQARRHDEGAVVEVLTPSPERVEPRCAHFGVCGGCALQHMDPAAQVRMKEQVLAETLARIGKVTPQRWLAPLTGEPWGYRGKARLGVRRVAKKGRVLVGFRERGSSFVADLRHCDVLSPEVGARLPQLGALVDSLSIRERLPQIEVARGDGPLVLVFRVLDPPSAGDVEKLLAFAADTGLHVYLQPGGTETIAPLPGQDVQLGYRLPAHGVEVLFEPADFTQVNLALNRRMVDQALGLLDPQPGDAVLDLFCGLGNFTLPLAGRAGSVVGVEGDAGLVARARRNAAHNGLDNVDFQCADLYAEPTAAAPWHSRRFDLALLDPPRSGAREVLAPLAATGVQRIVYVSCYPGTLARDAEHLVHGLGFRLTAAGAMDMFPHTAHLESMAVFERRA
ncbi:23S rRNA (uracil(1939)-C(5))-methyltransferase [Thiohalocapsa halophila]|uniref:23S rRNA (uracil(1939)-C(5))-methyltransferase RlmD n=1 Tax=Thiohalocapsa halophila TaxID=69359 RepID=A0ABS1CEE8_9GAMM|nr:23S rRNA (uracil(1939)-C(5))-methyltransferase RlmD [Thiohalocapsa halophila]MBK1630260.1 23S rRNA (uracil(1939)-C(5))-methyltransferase [Thiohalocapsa halophila]